jgi:hypothetical protein
LEAKGTGRWILLILETAGVGCAVRTDSLNGAHGTPYGFMDKSGRAGIVVQQALTKPM